MIAGRITAGIATAFALIPAGAEVARAGDDVVSATAHERPGAVRSYWTPARMRTASPAELAVTAAGRIERRAASPRTATDVSSASSSFPNRVHGKVFFTISGGAQPGDYVCSATAVQSNQHTLVWTAGHCVNDPEFGGGFATNWNFVPGYRNGESPFGEWPAAVLFTTGAWADDADIRQDHGLAALARDAQGRGIQDAVGGRPVAFGLSRTQLYTAFGYPAEPTLFEPTFDGQRLYSCESPVTGSDSPPGNGPDTMQIDCDMSGGSSGGGWVNDAGQLNGLTSYGYHLDFEHLYGPYFGAEAEDLYEEASGSPLLCGGAAVTNLGGAGADSFTGGDGTEIFKLKGEADTARGHGGADTACGGSGNDTLKGGDGDDTLRGDDDGDVLSGGPGEDLCIGGAGHDRARGCETRRKVP